jgi:hypothetical protein
MSPADEYRIKAAGLTTMAESESDLLIRAEFDRLARGYLLLAEQADRNAHVDVIYETPSAAVPAGQQQQQIQPKDDGDA